MSSVISVLVCMLIGAGVSLASARELRVCADPSNLPYSNDRQQGFENKLAELVGRDMGEHVSYTWYPQRGKFFRRTLDAGVCDVVMGVPEGLDKADTTRPYYRSTYVFVSRRDRNLHITSLDDPKLRSLRIGVHVLGEATDSLPPVQALLNRGIVRTLVGFSIFGNLGETNPAADLIRAVVNKTVDLAVAWGPLAGYCSLNSTVPLTLTALKDDPANPNLPFAFNIAMGVRPGNADLKQELDAEIERRAADIHALLRSYGIPQGEQ